MAEHAPRPLQIVLLRHGMPRIDKDRRLSAAEFGRWVAAYDLAGIDPSCAPPLAAIEQARSCGHIVCSDLPRSLESAAAMGIADIHRGEPLFREMGMPHARLSFPRLPVSAWSMLFRLLWAAGYAGKAESFAAARARARAGAERLVHLAAEHGTVLLVGHGSLLWFIARHLRKQGWSGPQAAPRKYWEFAVYRRPGA